MTSGGQLETNRHSQTEIIVHGSFWRHGSQSAIGLCIRNDKFCNMGTEKSKQSP